MIRLLLALLLIGAPVPALAQGGPQADHFLGRSVPITLREAVLLALQNNLDIEIARTTPDVASQQVEQAQGAFDPFLTASYDVEHDETPIASVLQGPTDISELNEDRRTTRSGITGMLPFGLEYASRYELRRLDTNSDTRSQLDPEWRAGWVNEITLPLLRDLILNEESVTVRLRRINESISNEDFRRELTDRILEVETLYWDLAAARAEKRVAIKSLQTAQDLLGQTEVRYEVGVVSRVAVFQAEAGVAEREVDAIVARNRAANAQDALLNTVLVPDIAGFANTELVPDDPAFIEYTAELDPSLRMALARRPEVVAARQRVDEAEIQLAFAENQRLPTLDLRASYTLNGLSGDPKPGLPIDVKSGWESAHDSFFRHDASQGYLLGGELSIPLGNTTARSLVAQRRIELRRTRTQLKSQEQEVILEVRRYVRGLTSARDAVGASERRRIAQEETLRAEQEKLRLGDSTPHDVLEFEKDLAEAERSLIASLKSYRDAIARLERGRATLLESRGISVEAALHR